MHSQEGKDREELSGSSGASEKVVPRDWSPISAINPRTGESITLYLKAKTVKITGFKGLGAARELMWTVRQTVQGQGLTGYYRGVTEWDDDGDENTRIYVAVPPWAYDFKTGNQVKAWRGQLFLVFVDEDNVIYWWRWDDADKNDRRKPNGFDQGRFLEDLL